MLIKLITKNIWEKRKRNLIAILSIVIGVSSFLSFLSLENGIRNASFQQAESKTSLNQIIVRPKIESSGVISLFQKGKNRITEEKIQQIKGIEGVAKVYPETQFNSFASLEANILGFSMITDAMIFGVPKELMEKDIKLIQKADYPYPALVPRKLLDLYNFAIAYPQGLPTMSEDQLIGKSIILYPNYSTFFPSMNSQKEEVKLTVVGFSDQANILGVTLPQEVITELNTKFLKNSEPSYLELFVETESPESIPSVVKQIEKLNLNPQYLQKNLETIESKLSYLTVSLRAISIIIIVLVVLAISSTFIATIAERRKEIGLFRALGASKKQITTLILLESLIIGSIGSIIGVISTIIAIPYFNTFAKQQLEKTLMPLSEPFMLDLTLIATAAFIGILITILSTLPPAIKAANQNPIKALKL